MNWKKIKNIVSDGVAIVFFIIGIIATIGGFVYTIIIAKEQTTSPVEKEQIDSLIISNDKIIIEVKTLDSIKDAKVIEVKGLDNDSTLRLFYELIRK